MLTRLSVRDFQAIQSADLELGPVNLIVGSNMAGKSAILRALHSLCFNRTGDGFIREGEEGTLVTVTDAEEAFTWRKVRAKSSSYLVARHDGKDGWSFDKTGSTVPDPIVEALKIRRIEVDSTFSIAPQFKMQHDTLLIQESGSRLARILGSLTKLDVVVKAQMNCRRDRDRAKKDKEAAEQEAERLDEQVAELDWVPGARKRIDEINETLALAAQAAEKYERVRRLIGERQRLQGVVARKRKVEEAFVYIAAAMLLMNDIDRAREPVRQYPRLVSAASRTQAIQIAKTNLRGAGEKLQEVTERKEGLTLTRNLVISWGMIADAAAGVRINLENQQDEVNTVEMLYRTACDEAELCDRCPWRIEGKGV